MGNKKKIWVTGSNGQLGNELQEIARGAGRSGYEFRLTDVDLDITDRSAVERFITSQRPDWIINAAAYTAVDRAEEDAERANALNSEAVLNLVRGAKAVGAGFVQISTDYVFDGLEGPRSLTEQDPTNPQSVYGGTKLKGEIYTLAYARGLVVRTAWLYSIFGSNFVKTMRRLGAEKEEVRVVADQWGTPTWAADLSLALMHMIVSLDRGEGAYGLYHYSNEGETTWAEFAAEIMRLSGLDCQVSRITTAAYPTPARRPIYSVLSKEKIRRVFGLEIPPWRESLARCINKLP